MSGQDSTCELNEDAKGVITKRACGIHSAGAADRPAEGQAYGNPPFVSGNTDAPADEGPLPTYDPSQQTPQEYAEEALRQLCADDVYANYELCAAYR